MSLSHAFTIVKTIGFANEINPDLQAKIMEHALHNFTPITDMIVYYPHRVNPHKEDEGRTLITFMDGLPKKVYAKKDDYGDPATWDKIYDQEVAQDLKTSGIARYVFTFMLAEDY